MVVQASLREDIVKLLVYSGNTPAPNIAHLLLGYDITKPLQEMTLQDPGEDYTSVCKVEPLGTIVSL